MTVRFRTRRDDSEPTLTELLQDETLHVLLARDGVASAEIEALMDEMRRKLGFDRPGSAAERFEAALFAECHAA